MMLMTTTTTTITTTADDIELPTWWYSRRGAFPVVRFEPLLGRSRPPLHLPPAPPQVLNFYSFFAILDISPPLRPALCLDWRCSRETHWWPRLRNPQWRAWLWCSDPWEQTYAYLTWGKIEKVFEIWKRRVFPVCFLLGQRYVVFDIWWINQEFIYANLYNF